MARNRHNRTWGEHLRQSNVGVRELDATPKRDEIWMVPDPKTGKLVPKLDESGNQIVIRAETRKPMAASTLALLDEAYSKGR